MGTPDIVISDALDGLRQEIRTRVQSASLAQAAIPETEWLEIVEVLRRRFNTLGMMERSSEVDAFGMDALAVRGTLPVLDFLLERYWRASLFGVDSIPDRGPALFAASCLTVLPCDVLMIAHAVYRNQAKPIRKFELPDSEAWVRFLIAPELVRLPFVQSLTMRLGGIVACAENARRLLRTEHRVVGRAEDRTVVSAAVEMGAPIIPVRLSSAFAPSEESFAASIRATQAALSASEDYSLRAVLTALGFFTLPLHWSMRFGAPIATRGVSQESVWTELCAQLEQ